MQTARKTIAACSLLMMIGTVGAVEQDRLPMSWGWVIGFVFAAVMLVAVCKMRGEGN